MATIWNVPLGPTELPEAALLADLTGIEQDLAFVAEICRRLEAMPLEKFDGSLAEALTTAAVIRYGRCFGTGVRTQGSRKLEEVVAGLPVELQERHERFLALRNRHLAHSVNAFEENQPVAWLSDRPEETEIHGVSVMHGRLGSIGAGDAAQLRELAEALRAALDPIEKAENAKALAAARALPYEDLRKRDLPDAFAPTWKDVGKRR